jgi:hypothetical protein
VGATQVKVLAKTDAIVNTLPKVRTIEIPGGRAPWRKRHSP